MAFTKITEQDSHYNHLEHKSLAEILEDINAEDHVVPKAINAALPQIELLTKQVIQQLETGGRLFYMGAGTSGRLGILDASECPPTFGVSHDLVIGLIAGGDSAIRKAVEFAEDDTKQGWKDLQAYNVTDKDFVIGIAASGTTPFVLGALEDCNLHHIPTGCITCNPGSPIAQTALFPIEVVVGPEYLTGSSRMKAGTAQKLILNMITTATMIRLGRVKGNKMVDMQLTNHKLLGRGVQMLQTELNISEEEAKVLLDKHQSVRKAIKAFKL